VADDRLNAKPILFGMKKNYPLSVEAEKSIEWLGGIDKVAAVVDGILADHGFHRGLFTKSELARIRRGRPARKNKGAIRYGERFASEGPKFHFDPGKSLRANINDLFDQARELQAAGGGTNYVGAMLQHLVGAKLDIVLGPGKIQHHGFSVADQSTDRKADYQVEAVAIHVTTHPTEALAQKCSDNIKCGLKPVIITLGDAVRPADFILQTFDLNQRVDVLDAGQFLTANVYERSLFKAAECKLTLATLLTRYNAIVDQCEADPSLRIKLMH
jgi:hypothetical protein